MLSLEDIKNVSFRRANFGGYKPEDVDAFIDDVQFSYENIIKEREELLLTINRLNEKIDQFYEEENSIKNVILSAQKIADHTMHEVSVKTTEMIKEAEKKSEKILDAAKEEVNFQNEISEKLKRESQNLKNKLSEIYEEHMSIINKIPGEIKDLKNEKNNHSVSFELASPQIIYSQEDNVPIDALDESKVSGGEECEDFKDLFSDDPQPDCHRRDLKFGKNYNPQSSGIKAKHMGAYSGIFRKNKK